MAPHVPQVVELLCGREGEGVKSDFIIFIKYRIRFCLRQSTTGAKPCEFAKQRSEFDYRENASRIKSFSSPEILILIAKMIASIPCVAKLKFPKNIWMYAGKIVIKNSIYVGRV